MMYNELVESYFFAPQHVGIIEEITPLTVHYRGKETNLSDVVDLYMLSDNKGLILKANFKAFGSPYLIAAAEWLCRRLEKSLLSNHPSFNYLVIMDELELPKTNMAVALQVDEAYKAVIEAMKKKLERNHDV